MLSPSTKSSTRTTCLNTQQGFAEGPLRFRPTYKLDLGTDAYDSGPKRRVPAWTDRVLFKPVRKQELDWDDWC